MSSHTCHLCLRSVQLSPKESSQRKGDPRVGAGYAGPLRYSAGRAAAELGAAPLRQSSPKAPGQPALLSASQGDPKGVRAQNSVREKECYGRPEKMPKIEILRLSPDGLPGPLGGAEQRRRAGGFRRGLSEGRSPEFRSRPACRVAQGTGVAGADPGSPFLCLLSFGEAKESKTRLKRGKQGFRKATPRHTKTTAHQKTPSRQPPRPPVNYALCRGALRP